MASDESGAGRNASYTGAVQYGVGGVTGDSNTGVALDSTTAVEAQGISGRELSSGFSVEAWVKASGAQTNRSIVTLWRPGEAPVVTLQLDEDGDYGLVAGLDAPVHVRTAVDPSSGSWEHVLATWDGSMLRLYENGC